MNIEEMRHFYLALPDPDKQIFLAFVSHDLTIRGRGFGLDLVEMELVNAFKGLNELQHQISSHIAGLGLGSDRYPDDVLWQILLETAAGYRLRACLEGAISRAGSASYRGKTK